MRSCAKTDVGRKRLVNQDRVFRTDNSVGILPNLYLVADGMGGANAGDYASRVCVELLTESVRASSVMTPVGVMQEAITKANAGVYKRSCEEAGMEGMGTTLVAATVIDGIMYVANIGDSRLYLIKHGAIRQVTEDHSLVEEMVINGEISREQARTHKNKNIITRALGTASQVTPDFFEVTLREGDIVLMCTDGLTNMLEDEEILHIVNGQPDLDLALQQLIDEANRQGGRDNIGVVLLQQ